MTRTKRTTICLEPELDRAVRRKAAALGSSISKVVNDAVRRSLLEDDFDRIAFEERRNEPAVDFDCIVRSLTR
jgi:hypothetical protein